MVRATDAARLNATLEALPTPSNDLPLSALADAAEHARLPRALAWALLDQRDTLLELLDEARDLAALACALARKFVGYARGKNQFLSLGTSDWPKLQKVFDGALGEVRRAVASSVTPAELGECLNAALCEHVRLLDAFVRDLCPEPQRADDILGAEPTSDEYSAELQIAVLRLEPQDLLEPLIDVGCGAQANLVSYLRARGLDAHGIDLGVANVPALVQADWMTYPFGVARWGTVVAHMSFTNHFVFQDRCSDEQAEKYAVAYLRILRSLKPGGAFYYAPAVPFMEQHLPVDFLVTRRPVESRSVAEFSRVVAFVLSVGTSVSGVAPGRPSCSRHHTRLNWSLGRLQ
jgi:hypothetical protein